MEAGAGLPRRRLGGELPSWLRPLQAPPQVAELAGDPGRNGGAAAQMRLLDGLELELGRLPGVARWALRLTGGRRRLGEAATLAHGAGLTAEAAQGAMIITAARLADLRPVLEGMPPGGRPVLCIGLENGGADPALAALRSGDEQRTVQVARIALLHPAGRGWAVLLHDPKRSGLPAAPAESDVALPEIGESRGRRLALESALAIGGIAAVVVLVVALRSAGSAPSSASGTQTLPATSAGLRTPAPLGVVVPVRPGPAPSVRQGPASAVDPRSGVTLFFGGIGPAGQRAVDFGDTWTWSRGTWVQMHPTVSPSARRGAVVAPDATDPATVTGSFLLVGGFHGDVAVDDTWLWNGSDWRPQPGPSPAGDVVAMAGDYQRHTMVLITRDAAQRTRTYIRSAGVWVPAPAQTPDLRLLSGSVEQGVIGLAPQRDTLVAPARTWRWTGSAWVAANPPTEPAFDSLTATLVAAPGTGPLLVQADFLVPVDIHGGTWSYDGRTWRHTSGPVPDFVRAFDATAPVWGLSGNDPVLIGGSRGDDAYRRVARWDGGSWS